MVVVAGFGNPLLDLTVKIYDSALLNKYHVQGNEMVEISEEQMKDLVADIQALKPILTPGGGAQNTIRLIQWILGKPNSTVMYGSIGSDEHAKALKELVEETGVETRYIVRPDIATGTSVALVNREDRTLLAYIGAAQYVQIKDLKTENFLHNIDLVLMEAFFLTFRIPVANYILETCERNKIPFVFSLSSVYMTTLYTSDMLQMVEKCDILLGHYDEYKSLIQALNLQDDVRTFAIKLCKKHPNRNALKYGKMCAITNSSQPALCVHSNYIVEKEVITPVGVDKLVDTTGAGDAFAAGFLSAFLKNRTPKECLQFGCLIAKEIVQQTGCTIPKSKPIFLDVFTTS